MRKPLTAMLIALLAAGCGGQTATQTESPAPAEAQPAPEAAAPAETPATATPSPMRNFAAVAIGPYQVQPKFEEEIEDGHYNLHITGAEFKAVRIWAGLEDPGNVMVVKTEVENDYQHGHVEVPSPIPAEYALWIEIEAPDGALHKGSTPLQPAN
jgi:hypothetical protein